MSASTNTISLPPLVCPSCTTEVRHGAKFCSSCGTLVDITLPDLGQQISAHSGPSVPNFALVSSNHTGSANLELRAEASKLMLLLARERIFLYMHWLIFVSINLVGLAIAYKCHNEYLGDDMTKLTISCTPLLFINCLTLICLVPIRGTRKEIARLKERLNYVKFQIDYGHLL